VTVAARVDTTAAAAVKRHRLFFALVPNQQVRRQAAAVQKQLAGNGRAVRPANLHVTLAFLGMQNASVIPEVCGVASGLSFPRCRVRLDHLGQFGRGRVLWLGAESLPAPLLEFQQTLVQGLTAAGIGHDPKPWKFHLTLYRRLRKAPTTLGPVAIEWDLDAFELIESVGSKNGVEYHSLARWEAARGRPR